MSDLLRVCLILILSLSIFLIPGLYIFEGFSNGFTSNGILITFILCIIQIILIIVLFSIKNIKTLISFLTINTGLLYLTKMNIKKKIFLALILILIIIKIIILSNFVQNGRKIFYQIIEKYPNGEQPTEWKYLLYYIVIKNEQCCGIDNNRHLPLIELDYFEYNFLSNCLLHFPNRFDAEHRYR
jgi:hypothetical protein